MRIQLALNVPDLTAAIDYYERLFGVDVTKREDGYANFEIHQPPLKLVLFEIAGATDRLNHLGVEVFDKEGVLRAAASQKDRGLIVEECFEEECCFAKQDKAISHAPDGTMWEWYVKTADVRAPGARAAGGSLAAARPSVDRHCC